MERGKPPSPTNRINLLDGTWALPPLLSVWKRTGKELAASIWSVTADRVSPLPVTWEEEWKWGESQKPSHARYGEVHEKKEWSQLDCEQDWHSDRRTTKRKTFA